MNRGGSSTRFVPGVSGNPGGTPRNAAVTQLARRYTIDAVRALVYVARLNSPQQASAMVAAARELIALGHGQTAGAELANALHLHLLAVQQVVPLSENEPFSEPPVIEQEVELAQWDHAGMLPAPREDLPDEALPLWDAYRVRHSDEVAEETPPTDPDAPGWEPMPWPKQS